MATEVLAIIIGAFATMQLGFAVAAISASRHRRRVAQMERVRLKIIEFRAHIHHAQASGISYREDSDYAKMIASLPSVLNIFIQQTYSTKVFDALHLANHLNMLQDIIEMLQAQYQEFSTTEETDNQPDIQFIFQTLSSLLLIILEAMKVTPTLRATLLKMVWNVYILAVTRFSSKAAAMRLVPNILESNLQVRQVIHLWKNMSIFAHPYHSWER